MSARPEPPSLGRRIAAYVIDGAIAVLILMVSAGILAGVSFASGGALPLPAASGGAYVVAIAWFIVYTVMQGGAGSIGMRIMRLELVHAVDDNPLGFGRALARNLVWGAGSAIVVGVFSPLFDGSPWRRGWHDLASGAVMTDAARPPAVAVGAAVATAAASAYPPPVPPVPPPPGPAVEQLPTPVEQSPAPVEQLPAPVQQFAAASATAAPGGVISFVPGVTGPAPARGAGEPATIVPEAVPLDDTRIATGVRPFAAMVWDDGARQALYGRTLFGRNPTPETGAHVVPVRDETLSLSKTHFELGVDDGRVWVIDRHSTNGIVVRRGAQRQATVPGERATVYHGDILEFGDRHVMVEVLR